VTSRVPALIVGGGISGLVCAYALRKRGIDAQLVDAAARPGGVIRSEQRDGFLLELGPQSFSGTPPLLALCRDLGIEDQLVQAPAKAPRYVLVNGSLHPVPASPPALLASSLLSPRTKWSIARDAFGKSQPPPGDESVADFTRRKFTNELLDRLVGPFVSGIYAGDPERLSIRSTFPQLYEAEKSAGSIIRGMMRAAKSRESKREPPTLLSFREGNETLARALAAELGTNLCSGTEVTRIGLMRGPSGSSFEVTMMRSGQEKSITADRLVVATPADVAGHLLANTKSALEPLLAGIEYAPIAIVSLGYRRSDVRHSLNGFGFLVARSARLRVLGTVWNSSLFAARAPEGYVLLTSFLGGATDPQIPATSQDNLVALVHRELAPLLGAKNTPPFSSVQVYRRALPQYNLRHAERLAAIDKLLLEVPGLRLVGNYLRGPAIGACVEQSFAASESL
jgi:oxygen-dependent protoporphyrinogen oxidase